jgi:hypothetical protein
MEGGERVSMIVFRLKFDILINQLIVLYAFVRKNVYSTMKYIQFMNV